MFSILYKTQVVDSVCAQSCCSTLSTNADDIQCDQICPNFTTEGKFKRHRQNFEGLFGTYFGNILGYWINVHYRKWSNENIFCHLVTLMLFGFLFSWIRFSSELEREREKARDVCC